MLERLATANGAKARILKVDATDNRSWAKSEQIKGVPTVQFYKGGKKLHEFAGAYPENEIQKKIDQFSVAKAAEPSIRPMPKNWLPPGVTKKNKATTD